MTFHIKYRMSRALYIMELKMSNIKKSIWAGLSVLTLTACQPSHTGTLYHSFTELDPVTQEITPQAWVIVDGDKIAKVGAGSLPRGSFDQSIDMSGRYALPGLIDAHAHITAGPHTFEIKDGAPLVTIESRDDITKFSARQALAFGVTTVRNPGGSTEANHNYDQKIASGEWIGPEAVHAGSVIQPLPMGGSAFTHPKTEAEWQAEAEHQAKMGMRYFKLYVSLNEEELAQGVRAAKAAGLKPIAHLDGVSWTTASKLGIQGLEHALPTSADLLEPDAKEAYLADITPDSRYTYRWFEYVDFEGPKFLELVESLKANQIELNFNFLVNHVIYNADNPDIFPQEWDRFAHPENLAAAEHFRELGTTGWAPEDFEKARAAFPKVLEFGKILYDAGLPIMIGTDGNGGAPYLAFEMKLHTAAGIAAWDVLNLATTSATEILQISDRTGRIEQGLEADIVFLNSNPLDDMMNIADVDLTLSNGKAYSFEEMTRMK